MAQEAIITQQSLVEAGIAASIAANPDMLPEPSVYFQDFNFGATMWDAAYGNVDGGSVSGVGEAVSDIAVENRIKLETEERKKDDPAGDASMIVELGKQQREEAARVANGQVVINGIAYSKAQIDDALDITEHRVNARADREGWSDERRSDAMESIQRVRDAKTPEEQAAATNEMQRNNPEVFDEFEQGLKMVREPSQTVEERLDSDFTQI